MLKHTAVDFLPVGLESETERPLANLTEPVRPLEAEGDSAEVLLILAGGWENEALFLYLKRALSCDSGIPSQSHNSG